MTPLPSGNLDIFLKRIRDIPSLPEVVNRIIEKLGQPNTPASEIAKMISYDPGLTTKVLRMVNSAAYGFPRQISSIQHAIMILGFNTSRGLVLSASIFRMFQNDGKNAEAIRQRDFWAHSLATAFATKVVANHYELPQTGEDAFSAGMLHDVGRMILEVYFQASPAEMLRSPRAKELAQREELTLDEERELFGVTHTEIGSHLANKWKLPVSITEVIQFHHSPAEASVCQPLVYQVALANQLSHMRLHRPLRGELRSVVTQDVIEYFDPDEDMLESLLDHLDQELSEAGDWMQLFAQGK